VEDWESERPPVLRAWDGGVPPGPGDAAGGDRQNWTPETPQVLPGLNGEWGSHAGLHTAPSPPQFWQGLVLNQSHWHSSG
jgi:hypothetical protein